MTIFDQYGIMDHVNEGDAFLVDRDFTIQEILLRKQATIFIPSFLKGRVTLTKEEVLLTKRIAKVRIHVERFNERLKRFRLLDGVISSLSLASQMVFVASCIVNFQEQLCI